MLSRRALAASHFELNHWQAIPVTQHYVHDNCYGFEARDAFDGLKRY